MTLTRVRATTKNAFSAAFLLLSTLASRERTISSFSYAVDAAAAAETLVDASTLHGKVMAGYQGWFAAPGDDSGLNEWRHWTNSRTERPDARNVHVAMWPDTSGYDDDELHDTGFYYSSNNKNVRNNNNNKNNNAGLYSAHKRKTVVRHTKWMKEYGVDGVFVQRFLSDMRTDGTGLRDRVLENVRFGAEKHDRVFANMWDVSWRDVDDFSVVADVIADWKHLVDDLSVTNSPNYLHHKGQPVVAIWGLGFDNRPGRPAQASALLRWFRTTPVTRYRATVVGGVPNDWRNTERYGEEWAAVFRSFDVISPWTVGRMKTMGDVATHRRDNWAKDMRECERSSRNDVVVEYLPVVFPGYSFHNANDDKPFNEIPRLGGRFYWHQLHHASDAGASMVYVAMFDEVDEGTAIYKVAANNDQTPTTGRFVTLNEDDDVAANRRGGCTVPSDWYLTLTGIATDFFRSGRTLPQEMPSVPGCEAQTNRNDVDDDVDSRGDNVVGNNEWITVPELTTKFLFGLGKFYLNWIFPLIKRIITRQYIY